MMINCPKCNELIGEELTRCPMCGYGFTDQDIAAIKKTLSERESKEYQYRKELIEISAKKRRRYGLMYFVSLVLMFAGMILTLTTGNTLWVNILLPVAIIAAIAIMVVGHLNGTLCCPHCGASLFRNNGKHCSYCGKRLN
jgi:transposase-like protein